MTKKADKKIVAKLAAGLKSQKEYEAETVARLEAESTTGCQYGFVSRLDDFGRIRRVLISIPANER